MPDIVTSAGCQNVAKSEPTTAQLDTKPSTPREKVANRTPPLRFGKLVLTSSRRKAFGNLVRSHLTHDVLEGNQISGFASQAVEYHTSNVVFEPIRPAVGT